MTDKSQLNLELPDISSTGADAREPAPGESFHFSVPSHERLLQQLAHGLRLSLGVQVVEGPPASGKTTLVSAFFRDYLAQYDSSGRVTVVVSMRPRLALRDSAAALGLPASDSQSATELMMVLRSFARSLQEQSRTAVLVVDAAQNLDQQTMAALLSLVRGNRDAEFGLKLVLWSEPGLIDRLDDLQWGIPVQDFVMPLLSPAETGAFLGQWVRERSQEGAQNKTGSRHFLLTASTIQNLWVESGGCIGLAKQLAQEEFEQASAARKSKPQAQWFAANVAGLPKGHIGALVVLTLVLIWALLAGEPGSEEAAVAGSTTAVAASSDSDKIAALGRGEDSLNAPDASQPPVSAPTDLAISPTKAPTVAPTKASMAAPAEKPATAEEALSLEPVIADKELRQALYGPKTPLEPASEPEPRALEREPELESELKPRPQPVHSHDVRALLDFAPSSYSLQIMSAGTLDSIEHFEREQPNQAQLYLYQTRRQGQPWFVLLAGNYPTREAARDAIGSLPEAQRLAGPWPRTLKSIQEEIGEDRDL